MDGGSTGFDVLSTKPSNDLNWHGKDINSGVPVHTQLPA